MSFSAIQSQLADILGMASIAARWIWGRGRHQADGEGRQERRSQSLQCSYTRLAAVRRHQGGDTLGMDRGGDRGGDRPRSRRRARFTSGSSAATGSSEGGEGGPSSPAPCSSAATELTTLEVTLCSRGDTGGVQPLEPPSKEDLQRICQQHS